jgi:hypothetical protein
MDPVIKLNVRRRVKEKNNSNKDDVSEDEEFDRQLIEINELTNNIENSNSALIPITSKDQDDSLEFVAYNEPELVENAIGTEVSQGNPKKGRGRPRKVPGALENSPKSPVQSSTQILRRSARNK